MSGHQDTPGSSNELAEVWGGVMSGKFAQAALECGEMPMDTAELYEFFKYLFEQRPDDFWWWYGELQKDPIGTVDLYARCRALDFQDGGKPEPPAFMDEQTLGEFRSWIEGGSKGTPPERISRWVRREIFGSEDPDDEENPDES